MKFRNETDKDKMVQVKEPLGRSRWIAVKPGMTIELNEYVGRIHGLKEAEPVKAVKSRAGPAKVETKIEDVPKKKSSRWKKKFW